MTYRIVFIGKDETQIIKSKSVKHSWIVIHTYCNRYMLKGYKEIYIKKTFDVSSLNINSLLEENKIDVNKLDFTVKIMDENNYPYHFLIFEKKIDYEDSNEDKQV